MTAVNEVVAELRAVGLAPTRQRRLVLGALEGMRRPVSAMEIRCRTREQGQGVSLTTIYRTLHALVEVGLVHVFSRIGELTYRHCRQEPHQHLVCAVCGLVVERPAEAVTPWLEQVRAEEDFVPDLQLSDLYGTCGTCLRADGCHRKSAGSVREPSTG